MGFHQENIKAVIGKADQWFECVFFTQMGAVMDLFDLAKRKKVLLMAHRGVAFGNIPCNSLQAFQIALNQGADIVELDVECSSDGVLFVQHPGMEKVHLGLQDSIKNYPSSMVSNLRRFNCDMAPTEWTIVTLEDALLLLRGKCIVNIDKFWKNPKQIAELVRRLGMEDQVLIKTANRPGYLEDVERYAPDLPYMMLVREEDHMHLELMRRRINYIGVEALFSTDDAPVASCEYLDRMHRDGKIVCCNAIVYDYREVLSSGHTDDVSMVEDPERGWGWIADRGFDLIQTDCLLPCRQFLEATGRRAK